MYCFVDWTCFSVLSFSVRSRALSALATVASSNHVENLPKAVYLTIQDQVSPAENGGRG